MENYEWTLPISLGGVSVEYRWREHFSVRGSIGHFGNLLDPATDKELDFDGDAPIWLKAVLLATVVEFRQAELRTAMPIFESFYPNREDQKSLIIELFERSQRGEYIGQYSNNANVYMQDIATLLRLTEREALGLIDELVEEGRLGLTGMILISYEDYEAGFANLLKTTGHRALTVSDFGHWSCSVCFAGGDDYSDPKDYPCIKPELDLD